jgi:imidazolonepropionase-like amidohydrolase
MLHANRFIATVLLPGFLLLAHTLAVADGFNITLIKNITLLSADQNQVHRETGFVLLEGEKITWVGKNKPALADKLVVQAKRPGFSYREIDGHGKYLTPGLIDSHVHTGQMIGFAKKHYANYPQLVQGYLKQEPRNYLYFGFTTLLDLGERDKAIEKAWRESEFAPNLLSVGQTVRQFDGYGHNFYPKPARYTALPNWVYNPEQAPEIAKEFDLSRHTPKMAVQNAVNAGAVAIKVFYEDGFSGVIKGLKNPSPALLAGIVSEAHAQRLPVLLHSTSLAAYTIGLNAKVDIFAHGLWHFEEGNFLDVAPPDRLQIEKVIDQVVRQGSYVQATLRVVLSETDISSGQLLRHPDLKHALPAPLLAWFSSAEGQWGMAALDEEMADFKPDKSIANQVYLAASASRVRHMVGWMAKKGVKLIVGTDSPVNWHGLGGVAGLNGWLELQAMAQAGVSLEQIFIAATSRNAQALKLDANIGSIACGKYADLLILNANPLRDIAAWNDIDTVIVRGKVIARGELSAQKQQ